LATPAVGGPEEIQRDLTSEAAVCAKKFMRVDEPVKVYRQVISEHHLGVINAAIDRGESSRGREVLDTLPGGVCSPQAVADLLRKSSAPRVVNVSSGAGQISSMTSYAPAYSISKAALNAVTVMLAAALPNAKVNCVDPGWVRTDMGGRSAPRSVEEGAETIVWLATLPPNGPTGGFFHDRKRIPW